MEYYDVQEKNNVLTITFHQHIPKQEDQPSEKLGINTFITYLYRYTRCSVIICDLSKCDYEYGNYISSFWLYGLVLNKKVYVIARESQLANLKSLMKLNENYEAPIYTDIVDLPDLKYAPEMSSMDILKNIDNDLHQSRLSRITQQFVSWLKGKYRKSN